MAIFPDSLIDELANGYAFVSENYDKPEDPWEFPYRASGASDCVRAQYLSRMLGRAPVAANQAIVYQIGHRAEGITHDALRAAGFEVKFPHGNQRGAHAPPDHVWTWDHAYRTEYFPSYNARSWYLGVETDYHKWLAKMLSTCLCGVHLDGVVSHPHLFDGAPGILELKCMDKYSYDRTCREGPAYSYRMQGAIQHAAWTESSAFMPELRPPEYKLFIAINKSAPSEQRTFLDLGCDWAAQSNPGGLEKYKHSLFPGFEDTFYVKLQSREEMDEECDLLLPYAVDNFKALRAAINSKVEPPLPEYIMADPDNASASDQPGVKHWKCRSYCGHALHCHNPAEWLQARDNANRRKR